MSEARPMVWSSTSINSASRNCPKVLDHMKARVPYDRDVFQAGIVAHAILQSVANWRAAHPDEHEPPTTEIAERQMQELLGKGRTYRGHSEPPPPIDSAWAGHRIAIDYLSENEIPVGLPEVEVRGEVGGFKVAALLDLVSSAYDFDTGETLLCVTDYKSSWATDADELDTIQRKIQAVLAWENRGGLAAELGLEVEEDPDNFDGLRLIVVNLRTGIPYTRDLPAGEVLDEYLEDWRRHVAVTIRGLEDAKVECETCADYCINCLQIPPGCDCADGPEINDLGALVDEAQATVDASREECPTCRGLGYTRRANPGPRCMGCPYLLACDAAGEFISKAAKLIAKEGDDARALALQARAYSVAAGAKDTLAKYLRHATAEQPIPVPGGEVGYRATGRTVAADGYAEKVAAKWAERKGEIVGLLEAASLTGYSMKSIARTLWPGRDKESIQRRERWLATVTTAKAGKEFGSWAK